MSTLLEYSLEIADDSGSFDTPLVTITSVRGGTNPYLSAAPTGDGTSFDPLTMESTIGVYTGRVADWDVGSMKRILTQYTEDASGRPRLSNRKARWRRRINGGSWGVLISGVITRLQQTSGAEWEVEISDPQAAGRIRRLFTADASASITDVLALYPTRGCLVGGPIMNGGVGTSILGVPDLGGWLMRAKTTDVTDIYRLEPVDNIYANLGNSPSAILLRRAISTIMADKINANADTIRAQGSTALTAKPFTTIGDTQNNFAVWPGLVTLIDGEPWRPLPIVIGGGLVAATNISPFYGGLTGPGMLVCGDGTQSLTNNALVRVRVLTALPSDLCPYYVDDHPADLLSTLGTAAVLTYDSDAVDDLRDAIGTTARIAFRIAEPQDYRTLVGEICRPYGIAFRTNSDGDLAPFNARPNAATVPTRTITSACVASGTVRAYTLDAKSGVSEVDLRQAALVSITTPMDQNSNYSPDALEASERSQAFVNADAQAGGATLDLGTTGMLHSVGVNGPVDLRSFQTPLVQQVFDRFGRGVLSAGMTLLRGVSVDTGVTTDDLLLGDHLLVELPELPHANYRLGDNDAISGRVMQIVRLTEGPTGYDVELVDAGPNAQPFATVPTVSIAASTDDPRHVAKFTITNASTLNAADAIVTVQWAVTDGSAPASADYADVITFPIASCPTGAYAFPPVTAGATVYVRATATDVTHRRSSVGTAQHVDLTAIGSATSLTATPDTGDGSQCLLEWSTTGSILDTDIIDVYVRFDGDAFADAWKVAEIPTGSIQYPLTALTPNTDYVATVQYRDPATNDVGAAVDVSFTTDTTSITLAVPAWPRVFTPLGAPNNPGLLYVPVGVGIGLAVIGAVGTQVAFEVAVETSIGSDTPGSYAEFARVDAASNTWTTATQAPPHDGKKRWLRARSVGAGTSSSYTTALSILPYELILPLANPVPSVTLTSSDAPGDMVNIGYTAVGDVEYAIDTGAYSTPPSNPFQVAKLESTDQTVFVRATLFEQTAQASVAIPRIAGGSPTVTIDSLSIAGTDIPHGGFTITWSITGTYDHVDVGYHSPVIASDAPQSLGNQTSPKSFTNSGLVGETSVITAYLKLYDASNDLLASSESAPLEFP